MHDRRAPQRHDRVAHEFVERSAMLEHLVDHLGEVLGEQLRDIVRAHSLGHRREPADIGEEHHDGALLAGQSPRVLLLRDHLRDVGREVALEVRAHQRFAPNSLRELRVLDSHRREAAERDQELEIFIREGVARREVVDVEDAKDLLVRPHERRAHRAAHALDQNGLPLETLIGGGIVRENRNPFFHRFASD